jgi:DNA-directed RNA polymerase specialized sigma subunit
MSKPMRIAYPGAVHHITARGNERMKIFLDDQEREIFLKGARQGARREESIYRSYVESGYTMKEIADYLGIHYVGVSRAIKKYEREKKVIM